MLTAEIIGLIKAGALVVCDHSAGKDSQAMFQYLKALVPREQLVVIHSHLPGVEWEGVVDHILNTIDGYEFHEVKAGKTFFEMVERRGMWPGAETRQCTSDLKRDPIDKKIKAICKERGFTVVINCMGIRAQESSARAKKKPWKLNKRNTIPGRTWFDWYPIFDMKIDWVWNIIAGAFQQPHWAYGVGMSRLSCAFCILASRKDHAISAKYNPGILDEIDRLEKKTGHTFVAPAKGKEKRYLKEILFNEEGKIADPELARDLDILSAMLNDPANFTDEKPCMS